MRSLIAILLAVFILAACKNGSVPNTEDSALKVRVTGDTTIFYSSAVIVNFSYIKSAKGGGDLESTSRELKLILSQIQDYLKDPSIICQFVETPIVKVKDEKEFEFSRTVVSQSPYKCLVLHKSGAVLPIADIQDFNSIKQAIAQGANYSKTLDAPSTQSPEEDLKAKERALKDPASNQIGIQQELPKNQLLQRGESNTDQKK